MALPFDVILEIRALVRKALEQQEDEGEEK
jgi:hypothetical protein